MQMCRACLSTESALIPLDDLFIQEYNILTDLKINVFDSMPQFSCQGCHQAVKSFINFRERCIVSETTLQQILLEQNTLLDTKSENIKQEVKVERADDHSIFDNDYDEPFAYDVDVGYLVKSEDTEDVKPKKLKKAKKKKITLASKIEEFLKEDKISCGLCANSFNEREALNKHLEEHKNDRGCGLCKEVFTHWPGLLGHRIVHITSSKEQRCHICNKRHACNLSMEHHYMTYHFEGEKIKLMCKHCSRNYETPRKLKKHMWSLHSKHYFICDYCSKSYNNKSNLRAHIRIHSEKKEYVCDTCGFSCKFSGGLRDHIARKHSAWKTTCKVCRRVFPSPEAEARHRCKQYERVCPICGLQLARTHRLERHMATHRAVGRYQCARCPATYKSRAALAVHADRHDGRRTKQCDYCPLKFYSASVLIKHRRVHTGEKPYVCKICQKGFTGNNNLKVHMKVHGEYLVVKKNKEVDLPSIFNP